MRKHGTLFLFQGYIFTSFLLYYFGPILYPKTNTVETVVLFFSYNLFFLFGYWFANSHIVLYNKKIVNFPFKLRPLVFIGSLLSIFFSLSYLQSFSGSLNFFSDVFIGLTNPGEAYQKNYQLEKESHVLTQLMTLLSPLTYCIIPIGFYHLKSFGIRLSALFIISIILLLLTYVIKGTNFFIIFLALILIVTSKVSGRIGKISLSKKILFSLAILYFLHSISSRMQITFIPTEIFGMSIDSDHVVFTYLPETISIPLMLASSYVSQGYHALALASSYDFQSTFGLGSGRFLIGKLDPLLNLWDLTYQSKMDSVWNSKIHWHTAYVWFANDVGLYGVTVVMAIIGFFFSLVLKDAKENKSILAIILLPLYALLLLFLPANNIIFSNPLTFMSFIFFNFLWVFSKRWRIR